MQKVIDIRFLGGIKEAAQALVQAAPAQGDYFGVMLRARYTTTRPDDVVAYYERIIRERTWSYGANIPKATRDRMRCDKCGATGCKMWREYQTFADRTEILCGPCALASQGKTGTIDAGGYIMSDLGKCDQIGWRVPAVPTHDGTFWGYTSVPAEGVAWWRALPSYSKQVHDADTTKVQTFLVDNCPEVLAYGEHSNKVLSEALTRWLTLRGTPDEILMLKGFAVARGYAATNS